MTTPPRRRRSRRCRTEPGVMTPARRDRDGGPPLPERSSPVGQTPRPRARGGVVVDWIGWHLPELLGIGAPLVGAWLISAWCALASAAVAAWWAGHELRASARGSHLTVGASTARRAGVDTGERAGQERGQSA